MQQASVGTLHMVSIGMISSCPCVTSSRVIGSLRCAVEFVRCCAPSLGSEVGNGLVGLVIGFFLRTTSWRDGVSLEIVSSRVSSSSYQTISCSDMYHRPVSNFLFTLDISFVFAMTSTAVLITGANRSLGLGLLQKCLAQPNHMVIAGNRNPAHPSSQALAKLLKGKGTKLIVVKIDASVAEDASGRY